MLNEWTTEWIFIVQPYHGWKLPLVTLSISLHKTYMQVWTGQMDTVNRKIIFIIIIIINGTLRGVFDVHWMVNCC